MKRRRISKKIFSTQAIPIISNDNDDFYPVPEEEEEEEEEEEAGLVASLVWFT